MDEWRRVTWSDESRFLIHQVDGRVKVRRLPGEQLLPSCTAGHAEAGGGGIMLKGTFSWAALGPVVVVEQIMKAANYLNIIIWISCTLKWRLPSQMEMESSSRTTPYVTRLGLYWSGLRSILMNST
ncbi:hypothetical protein AVEN_36722-1 [Araneus ventricosus]|uniref:Transposable element Tc1 transposase n=1 Tax=Araneus ventricosus TaxID=182803 RepID=A0A4Y2IKI5_ARAVE|nr:hypothetical protein AVEN_36722-1 [Araneus ventricosus]